MKVTTITKTRNNISSNFRLLLVFFMLVASSFFTYGQVLKSFTQRTSSFTPTTKIYSINGDFTMIGNTNMTLVSYDTLKNNSNNDMKVVDNDGVAGTTNSSSATLAFSTENGAQAGCSKVLFAGLYWTARPAGGVTTAARKTIKYKGPGQANYKTVSATSDIQYPGSDGMYAGFYEVTSDVQAWGAGEYWVADIAVTTGDGGSTGYYGGWGMVVIYENSKMNLRDITVFDGYAYVQGNTTISHELPVSGFNTALSGPVNMKMGMMSGEGDVGISGDYFKIKKNIDGTFLSLKDTANSTTNFFNSSITGGSTRNPSLKNNTGVDIHVFNIPNAAKDVIGNNQTSTTFQYGSTQDTYIIFNIIMSVDAYKPVPEAIVSSITPGTTVFPCDEVEYKVEIRNKGSEAINNAKIVIPLPYTAVTYLSSSKTVFPPASSSTSPFYDPSLGANGSIVWDFGTLPLPADPNTLLAELKFKLKVSCDCNVLKSFNCPQPDLTLTGNISGIGDTTHIPTGNVPFILGLINNPNCSTTSTPGPLVKNIDATAFIAQNCQNTPNLREFIYCNQSGTIPITDVLGNYPLGSTFFNEAETIEYTINNPFPATPGTTTYHTKPPGSSCFYIFKITVTTVTSVPIVAGPLEYCQNATSVPLTATASNPAYTLYYYAPSSSVPQLSITPSTATVGTFNYLVAEGPSSTCISPNTATIPVKINPLPTPSITGPAAICVGKSGTLDAGTGYAAYSWSTGETTQTISVSSTGTYTIKVTNAHGCTGTTGHEVATKSTSVGDTTAFACNSFNWYGVDYSASASPTHTFTNASGCDSVVTLHLTIGHSNTGDTTAFACNSFNWYGVNYSASASPTHTFINASGCDSVVTLHLTIGHSNTGDTTAFACNSFNWYGVDYSASASPTHSFTNVSGCDSVVTLHLTIGHSNTGDTTAFACNIFNWYGVDYSASASPIHTFTNVSGCDSVVTLHLTIGHSNTGDTTAFACNSFNWYGVDYSASASPTHTFTNASVCDSVVTLHLTIGTFSTGDTTAFACNSFNWYGINYTTSASPTHTFIGTSGCDSVVTLHLTIGHSNTGDTTAFACNSFNWYGVDYNASASPTHTFTNASGCDSVVTLHLTIGHSNTGDTTAFACNSFNWYGVAYIASASPTHTFTNVSGCDSVVTLHLTIGHSNTGDTTAFACTSFNWYGVDYSASASPKHTFTNVSGCDSVVTLHLTIGHSNTGDTTAFACNSFNWYGVNYSASASPTRTFTNASGCDSVVTLHLTIGNFSTGDTTALACNSFNWYGINYTTSASPAHTFIGASGCDSVVTLHLTIGNSNTGDTIAFACNNFNWHGTNYSTSASPTHTFTNGSGCDSVVTLHLTIGNSNTGDTTASACNSFNWYGVNYTASATPTHTFTNASGCDSVVTLHLTIGSSNIGLQCGSGVNLSCANNNSAQICASALGSTFVWSGPGIVNSNTGDCIHVNAPGTYTVIGTNTSSGCTQSCFIVVTQDPALTANCSGTPVACKGGNDGFASVLASGGHPFPTIPYKYLWNNGATTSSVSNLTAGTYTVTVTDNHQCTATCSYVVAEGNNNANVTITPNSPIILCSGGSVQLCASGASTFKWSPNGETTACINITLAGTYSVIGTTTNGCTGSAIVAIPEGQPLNCSITGCDRDLCSGESAQLCAPSGYASYSWSTGSTNQCITVNSTGTYSVKVTNSSGCTSICNKYVHVSQPPVCSIDITGCGADNTLCNGQTAQLCAASGSGYKYLWSTGSTKQCITVGSAGTYSVTITNSAGCSSTCKQVIKSGQPPVCSIDITGCGADNTLCNGQTAQLCAASGSGYKYLWSTGSTKQCITVGSAGTYSVTITNSAGCSSTCKQVIKSGQPPVCSIDITGCGADNTLCNGQSAQLCAASGNGYKYLWSTGSTKQCITVSSAGTYSVTITNSAGCSSTCKQVIKSGQPPVCSIDITGCGADNTLCNGQSAQLCAASGNGYKYLWSTGSTKQCITVSSAGTYSVTITNSAGCSSTCKQVIKSGQPPVCSINITGCGAGNSLCNGQTAQLCASSGNGYKYLWNTGSTKQCITVSTGGTYSVTVTNSAGCSSSCKEVIYAGQPPVCSINITGCGAGNSLCNGQTAQLCASSGNGYKYLWNTGSTKQCITVSTGGTYSVTVTNSAGCSSTCKEVIYAGQPPVCSINITGCGSNNSLCNGQTAQLCASSGNGYKYLWNTGSTKQCITVSTGGTYSVMVTNSAGCSSVCKEVIYSGQPPVCSINITGCGSNNSLCNGQTAQLCAASGNGYKYLWNTGSTKQCITVNKAATYSVMVTNSAGCSSICNAVIYAGQPPVCSINITGCGAGNSICNGQTAQLCASSGNGYKYLWSTGSTKQCITVNKAGTYSVTVTNSAGCSSTCKEVIYSGQPSCNITGDLRIRHGESTTLCGPSGYASYKWSTGSNSRCITVKCAGNYSLTVTNSSGCSSTCSVCVVEDCYRLEEKGPGESSSAIQVLAYPNPFGSSLSIEFQRLDQSAHTVVELYALDGKKVATLFDKEIEAGIVYKAEFKAASELADGLYIYRITSGGEVTNGVLVRNAAH